MERKNKILKIVSVVLLLCSFAIYMISHKFILSLIAYKGKIKGKKIS